MTEPDDLLRLVTFNQWVGQRRHQLRDNLRDLAADTNRPHVIARQEARRHPRLTIPGYRQTVFVDNPRHEDDLDCVLLVRNDVTVVRPRFVRVDGPMWRGPKHGLIHAPKVFVGATLEHLGKRWDVLDVHRTWTGRGRTNMESWDAEDARLHAWLVHRSHKFPRRPIIALGDWNGSPHDRGPTSVARLANDASAMLAFKGIDGAMACNVSGIKATELPGRYGSDGHSPVAIKAWR